MKLTIYTDGGSLGNPGPSASGYALFGDGKPLFQEGKFIGHATNNQAEYKALIFALEKVRQLVWGAELKDVEGIDVVADSELMVRQLNGIYKVKNADIRENIMTIRLLEADLAVPVTYTHTMREGNQLADSLVKKALKEQGYSV